jgi:hypothetical protein
VTWLREVGKLSGSLGDRGGEIGERLDFRFLFAYSAGR